MRPSYKTPLCLALALLGTAGQAIAADDRPWGQINDNLRITGELRGRYEAWNYFAPDAASVNDNNDYGFFAIRARLGALFTSSFLDAYAQGEYTGLFDLPDNAVAKPGGALGTGATYFSENRDTTPQDVHVKQAYVNFKGAPWGLAGWFLKAGRFEILDGLEYKSGDAKFDGLKASRVSQRLIGPFDFTHATRNFDGFSLAYDQSAVNLTVDATHPTQGGFNIHAQEEISHIDLFYAAITGKKDAWLPGTEERLFYLYYGDDRDVQVLDNRPATQRTSLSRQDLKLHTVGTHWLTVQPVGSGSADGLLWAAYQFGRWADLDQRAWAVDAEAGYQWTGLPLKPWLRAVYYRGSGDSDARDGEHGTFFQVLPTARPWAKTPFYNLMNLQDVFVQFIVAPTANTKVSVDAHHLSLDSSNDLFYAGGGASSRSGGFGYAGRASGGRSTVGQLVDIGFSHQLSPQLSWSLYYGHAFGGPATGNVYRGKNDADFAYAEFSVVF